MGWAKSRGVGKTSVFPKAGAPQGGAAAAGCVLWVWRGGGV
ncbi:hypothetical protein [Pyrobaculum ferrireducens]|uniref:Uncharacterized protein n=1 Tax=Pyrobaculum ferrireducens TaxID=1104324 RepID=G7VFU4_9CREN|nr:hypothetical protein [Pyrobaculum ferrireducens]AET31751.1 hypothetical protein P186_0294 [Pyrobaculum ferrireducens]